MQTSSTDQPAEHAAFRSVVLAGGSASDGRETGPVRRRCQRKWRSDNNGLRKGDTRL